MIVNSSATVIDSLARGASVEQAARAGLTAAVLSIPGGLIGGEGQLSRLLLGPLTSSGTAYIGAIANGAPPDRTRRAAIVALATAFSTGGLVQGREDEVAGYYRAGQQFGATARSTTIRTTAAVMVGLAQAAPPVRTVGGATTTLTMSRPAGSEQAAVRAAPTVPTVPVPEPVQVAPDVTPATPAALPVTAPTAVAPAAAQQVTAPATGSAAPVVSAATFATSVAPAVAAQAPAPVPAPAATPAPAAVPATAAPSAPTQGPTASTVAPNVETELGMTAAQREAARGAFSGNLTSPANAPLGAVWNQVAVPGQAATLTPANSRRLFDLHRTRFWRAVRRDPAALQVIRNLGGTFPEERNGGTLDPTASSVPEIDLAGGIRLRISLDHEVERQTAPNLALDPNNLRLSTVRENTVLLRQLHEQDPFINPPPGWTPSP
jgi:hypothetical protein